MRPAYALRNARPLHHATWVRLAFVVALVAGAGCRQLSLKDGFPCSKNGECPSPYHCGGDQRCYRQLADGASGDPDASADARNDGPDASADGGHGGADGGAPSDATGVEDAPPGSLAAGQPCESGTACKSGFCVDRICCSTTCDGACMACAAHLTNAENGTCAPVTSGLDPHDSCQATPAEGCGNDGWCDGAGACRKYASNQPCAAATCVGSTFTATRTCDGKGTCAAALATPCGTAPCTLTGCAAPCTKDDECTPVMAGAFCEAGTCKAKKANGETCATTNQCLSGFCSPDGLCCDSRCDGKCVACASAKTGQANGKCAAIPSGQDPDNECPADAAKPCGFVGCNGQGACLYKAAGQSCGAASCTSPNTYAAGATCDGAGACNTSAPQICPGALICASATACKQTCGTDSDCVSGNYCSAGACVPKKGSGVTCTNGNECTTGFCSGDKHCCNTACNASGGCQSCNAGTCSTTSGLAICSNQCVNTGTDPNNCGMCGKKCNNVTTAAPGDTNHGVARCSNGSCVAGCGQGYRLCDNGAGGFSCVGATWTMEGFNHIPATCGPAGGRLGNDAHSPTTSIELTGTGDPLLPECFTQADDTCPTNPTGNFTAFPGSTVSVWIKTTVANTQCWLRFDSGQTSSKPVPAGTWTQLSWVVPLNSLPTGIIQVTCDLADGATWYVDDISLTQQ